jgi:hypothetical protein
VYLSKLRSSQDLQMDTCIHSRAQGLLPLSGRGPRPQTPTSWLLSPARSLVPEVLSGLWPWDCPPSPGSYNRLLCPLVLLLSHSSALALPMHQLAGKGEQ